MDIYYEELQNFNFVPSDEKEDDSEFLMINPDLLKPDLIDTDIVNNSLVMSTIIDNLLLLNEQFYEICSQLNEGQQHLIISQCSMHFNAN